MRRTLLVSAMLCAAAAAFEPPVLRAQGPQSPALVKELVSLMTGAKLDAIAVQDPQTPDRFVAAMLFPGVQLLMVAANHASADYVRYQIGQKQYKEVYGLLQQSGAMESRIFFQDLGADGLKGDGQSVDVMYERGVQTVFGGDGDNRGKAKDGKQKTPAEADAEYARLLKLAIDGVRAHTAQPQ